MAKKSKKEASGHFRPEASTLTCALQWSDGMGAMGAAHFRS